MIVVKKVFCWMLLRAFADAVLQLPEYNRFSKGLFAWVGFRTKWVEYENVTRAAGESKWTFFSLFKYNLIFNMYNIHMAAILNLYKK